MAESFTFGDLLRRYRLAAGLTQEELAERAGLSVPGISDLERGARRAPQRYTVQRLVAALQLAPADRSALEAAAQAARPRGAHRPAVSTPPHDREPPDQELVPPAEGPRAASRRPLPTPLTGLIGRVQEQAEVRRLLATTRLLTLTGPGGCGKTRLALHVATTLAPHYRDGVYWVELAALRDPLLVPQAMASALDLREEAGRPLPDTLREYLQARTVLLLLDNCEHLVVACAELVATLLQGCPQLRVLATSREALALTGEVAWPVPPLAVPPPSPIPPPDELAQIEAVRLFIERAQAARPDFRLREENAPAVAAICLQLEGMPLAIELAAARLPVLPVGEIAARLGERLRLLTGGSRTAPARHQTLRATLDWSYLLLDEPEQMLLRRLAVFAGGWTLEAAEAVCAGGVIAAGAVLDLLTQLVRKSLLVAEEREGAMRYRLLETVRQYAYERLVDSGETDMVERQYAAHYLALAEEAEPHLTGPQQARWLAVLEQEHDNLRAVLQWARARGEQETALRLAGALWPFWQIRGHLSEGRAWLEALPALDARDTEAVPAGVRVKVIRGGGVIAAAQGDYGRAVPLYERSLLLYRQLGDQIGIARSLASLGVVAFETADYERATALYEQGLALLRQAGDTRGVSALLNNLANVALVRGAYERATALHEESLALKRELGDRGGTAVALNNLAIVAQERGDYARARALNEESLAIKRALGDKPGIVASLNNLGELAQGQGDYARATALHQESLAIRRELGETTGVAFSLFNLGEVARLQGDFVRARALYGESLPLFRQASHKVGIVACLEGLAALAAAQGKAQAAARLYGAAAALREAIGRPVAPADRAGYDGALAAVRAALGEAAFTASWAAGQALTLEQAIAAALEESPS